MAKAKVKTNGRTVGELLVLLKRQKTQLKPVRLDASAEADIILSAFKDGRRVDVKKGMKWGSRIWKKGEEFPWDENWAANITKLAHHGRFVLHTDLARSAGWRDAKSAIETGEKLLLSLEHTRSLQTGSGFIIEEQELRLKRALALREPEASIARCRLAIEKEQKHYDELTAGIENVQAELAAIKPSLEAALV